MKTYESFKTELEKKLPDHKPMERVIYMLRHPVHLKTIGSYQLLADYLLKEVK